MSEPERRYRRLLWAYPGPYRREHGTEIVTTLLDLAESGTARPSLLQALHLVACGVRQRFRLPAGRGLAAVAAVLAAMAFGAVGAAGGIWLGWQTATPVPSTNEVRALAAATAGDGSAVEIYPWQTAMNGRVVGAIVRGPGSTSGDRLRAALVSAGWQVRTLTEYTSTTPGLSSGGPAAPVLPPTRSVYFTARKGGLSLAGSSDTVSGGEENVAGVPRLRLDVWSVDTAGVRPSTIVGLLLGGLAGWLFTAALANRARRSGPARRTAVALLTVVAFVAAAAPAFVLYRRLYQVLSYDISAQNPYIVDGKDLSTSLLAGCTGIALAALATVILIVGRGARTGPVPIDRESAAPN
jgi:hypothetical protein